MASIWQIWIHNFGLLAKPLYEAVKAPKSVPQEWTKVTENAFREINHVLIQAPALEYITQENPYFSTYWKGGELLWMS